MNCGRVAADGLLMMRNLRWLCSTSVGVPGCVERRWLLVAVIFFLPPLLPGFSWVVASTESEREREGGREGGRGASYRNYNNYNVKV